MTVRVKICGITRVEDARAAIAAGANMIGLNFYAKTPRFIEIDRAREVREAVGPRVTIVGVFVNAERDYIDDRIHAAALDMIQFAGDEDDAAVAGWTLPTIVTRRVKAADGVVSIASHRADYTLLDALDGNLLGGTGCRIALDQLRQFDLSRAFVAGGLTSDNVAEVSALRPYAVDCASGVESSPGVKDHNKIRSFVANAKRPR